MMLTIMVAHRPDNKLYRKTVFCERCDIWIISFAVSLKMDFGFPSFNLDQHLEPLPIIGYQWAIMIKYYYEALHKQNRIVLSIFIEMAFRLSGDTFWQTVRSIFWNDCTVSQIGYHSFNEKENQNPNKSRLCAQLYMRWTVCCNDFFFWHWCYTGAESNRLKHNRRWCQLKKRQKKINNRRTIWRGKLWKKWRW